MSHDFLKYLDCSTQTDTILLDFAKAFDKIVIVSWRLIKSLSSLAETPQRIYIDGSTLGWIRSCLYDRDQTVRHEGK